MRERGWGDVRVDNSDHALLAMLASGAVEPDRVGAIYRDGEYRHGGALSGDRHHSAPEAGGAGGFEGLAWCIEATLCHGVRLVEC